METPLFNKLQLAIENAFGCGALLFPFSQRAALGDFGWYQNGVFRKFGNLFSFFDSVHDGSLYDHVETVAEENLFLTEASTLIGETASWLDQEGVWQIQKDLYHRSLPGFALFAKGIQHQQLTLTTQMAARVRELIQANKWKESFRIVWQRTQVEHLSFAVAREADEKLMLSGAVSGPYEDLLNENLLVGLYMEGVAEEQHNWMLPHTTMSVNMAHFDPSGEEWINYRGNGLRMDELRILETEHFILDNTNSFL